MDRLKGNKTYLCAGLVALSALAYAFGLIDRSTFEALSATFGAGAARVELYGV